MAVMPAQHRRAAPGPAVPIGAGAFAAWGAARAQRPPRPRVLVCAYACNPEQGSEEAVGWSWVGAIAAFCEVTVITAAFHRPAIEAQVAAAPAEHWSRRVVFVYPPARPWHYAPTPRWRRIEGSVLKPVMHRAYRGWQAEAARLAAGLVAGGGFDLTHQITYVGFRFPGGLWRLPLPFVWGPLGGLEDTPWRLFPALGPVGMLYFAGRNLINAAQRRWLRAPRRAALRAGPGLIAATSATARLLDQYFGVESVVISEVTAPALRRGALPARAPDEPLRLLWSGGHTPGKALPLLLYALAALPPRVRWTLDIFGGGPSSARWRRLAGRLGLAPCCIWHGQVPRGEAIGALDAAHLFIITSLKDLTSTVLVEALGRGVPVLCPDHCGFADAVTDASGRRLDIRSPGRFIAALTAAITDLYDQEPVRQALAAGALARAADFTIEAKAADLRAVYTRVLATGRGS